MEIKKKLLQENIEPYNWQFLVEIVILINTNRFLTELYFSFMFTYLN